MSTILVVDDSEVDRRLVGGLLEQGSDREILYAENGSAALDRMRERAPDIVVTDLQMPEMDGLELVAAARAHFSDVPVVLITAHGSELLAVEALERGAASYVPKSQLAAKLAATVDELVTMAKADRSYERLIDCMHRTEFTFVIGNDPDTVDALVDLAQKMVVGVQFCDFAGRLQIGVALKAALTNALFHGNLEVAPGQAAEDGQATSERYDAAFVRRRRDEALYRDRGIFVDVHLTRAEIRFIVRDAGKGFDADRFLGEIDVVGKAPDSGRGISLMQAFMDDVTYNDAGNEVTMTKRRREVEDPSETVPLQ